MLKAVSSITNAIGALNYKGTWNASTNTPALASGVGTKGDYYVVSVAGSTNLDGISNWGIGDWAVFNGSVWQRVEGGADLNGVNLSVSGTSTFGDNATFSTAAKGFNFTANTPAAGMTSQLLNWYEAGTWTPVVKDAAAGNAATAAASGGLYTRVGKLVTVTVRLININTTGLTGTNQIYITGLPFASKSDVKAIASGAVSAVSVASTTGNLIAYMDNNVSYFQLYNGLTTGQSNALVSQIVSGSGQLFITLTYTCA